MKKDLIVTRIIDAPLEKVWKAWTDPNEVMKWWGPEYYTSPSCKIDLREGGSYIFCMRAPKEQGGQDSYTAGVYTKIVPIKLLEFTQGMADKDGNSVDPTDVGLPADFPKKLQTQIKFEELKGMTKLTIIERDWTVSQMFVFSLAGLHQSIDKLQESLA